MSEQMKELRDEIEQTLNVERQTYADGAETDTNIQGWIEALEYVLGQIDHSIQSWVDFRITQIQQDTLRVVSDWFDSDENEWRRLEQALRLPLTPLSWEGEEE